MTNFNTAFNLISPYDQTQIHDDQVQVHTKESLLQQGYTRITVSSQAEAELCNTLVNTIETIKDFIWNRFHILGLDNKGTIPDFYIHLEQKNAFYVRNPTECFKFNDAFINSPEVVCHEFTHGIIQNINPLGSSGQGGALNEALADIIGIMFKRYACGIDDWKMTDERDLSKSFNFKDLKDARSIASDSGHVHHNSLIISHAFYLASIEHKGALDKELVNKWFEAFVELEEKEKTFVGFAAKTIKVCEGHTPLQSSIIKAWKTVGLIK